MSFFNFNFNSQADPNSKFFSLLILSMLILLGGYNIAHGIILARLQYYNEDVNALSNKSNDLTDAQFHPAWAVLIVAGSVVIPICFITILAVCGVCGLGSRVLLSTLIYIGQIVVFGLEFAVGVYCTIITIYYKQLYAPYLTNDAILANNKLADGPAKNLYTLLPIVIEMCITEAVLAFVIGLVGSLFLSMALIKNISDPLPDDQYEQKGQSLQKIRA